MTTLIADICLYYFTSKLFYFEREIPIGGIQKKKRQIVPKSLNYRQ